MDMGSSLIRDGYDVVAQSYLADRDKLKSGKYLQQLLKYLPKHATILDLGCGAGVPVDDVLLKAGHRVIGVDISSEQIKLARRRVPGGEYIVGDIQELTPSEYSVQAIVSFYAIFHIPRERQLAWFKTIATYLSKGGILLVTMGDREFEGSHILHGQPMWSSQYGTAKNRQMIETAGFKILVDELDTSGGERHQAIMGERV